MKSQEKIDRVLVVGDIMIDTIVKPKGKMVYGSDVKADIAQKYGGSAANQAVWLAKNNIKISLFAKVACCDFEFYQNQLLQQKVTSLLQSDKNLPTGHLVTLLDENGERSFFTDRGANINLCLDDIPTDIFNNISLLLLSGYTFFEPKPKEVALYLIKKAKEKNIPVAIDPASSSFLKQFGVYKFLNKTKGAFLFFPNSEEAEILSGSKILEEQVKHLSQYYEYVVIKRGAKGAIIGTKKGIIANEKAKKIKAKDTTGAGDAFLGGFISALSENKSLKEALKVGNIQGAIAAAQLGGQPQ